MLYRQVTVYIRTHTDGSRPQPYQFINLSIHIWRHTNSPAEKPSLDIPKKQQTKKVTRMRSAIREDNIQNVVPITLRIKQFYVYFSFYLKFGIVMIFFKCNNQCITGLDRPWRFQGFEAHRLQDNRHTKVVSLSALCTGPSTPRKYSWYSFLLQTESTPGPQCGRKNFANEKLQRNHRESNSRPYGL